MVSFRVHITLGDGHPIFDAVSGKRTNTIVPGFPKNKLHLKKLVWIGADSIILGGTQIGQGSIVGSGSLVKSTFPNNCILAGNPARVIKKNMTWSRNNFVEKIEECGEEYIHMTNESVQEKQKIKNDSIDSVDEISAMEKRLSTLEAKMDQILDVLSVTKATAANSMKRLGDGMAEILNSISAAQRFEQKQQALKNIFTFEGYLSALKELDHVLIFFAVKDTAGEFFRSEYAEMMHELGFEVNLTGYKWSGYLAVTDLKELHCEKLGAKNEAIRETIHTKDGICIEMTSMPYRGGNMAKIQINSIDHAVNKRGINIVVYDTAQNCVLDSVCFDTHDRKVPSYRDAADTGAEDWLPDMKNSIRALQASVNKISDAAKANEEHLNVFDEQIKLLLWHIMSKQNASSVAEAKKDFFKNIPKASGTLRDIQQAGVILLRKLDEVCRENGLTYWLDFGTLLGAIRHRGFIPWDDDTDVGMMRRDAEKLCDLLDDDPDFRVTHLYFSSEYNLNHCVQLKFQGISAYCLDIFIHDYCDDISPDTVCRQMDLKEALAREAQPIRLSKMTFEEKQTAYKTLFESYLEKSRREIKLSDTNGSCMIWALDNTCAPAYFQGNCAISDMFPLEERSFEGWMYFVPKKPEEFINRKYVNHGKDIYTLPKDMLTHVHFNLTDKDIDTLHKVLAKHARYLSADLRHKPGNRLHSRVRKGV